MSKKSFVRNIMTVLSGTIIAQLIGLMATPLITRLYEPSSFGVFALFTSTVTILAVVGSMRYELAIVLPKRNVLGVNLMVLSFIILLKVTLLILVVLYFWAEELSSLYKVNDYLWLWFVPISTFLIGCYQILSYWHTRTKQFSKYSMSQISRSLGITSSQLGLGTYYGGSISLVFAQIIGQFTGVLTLGLNLFKKNFKVHLKRIKFKRIYTLARRYNDLPKYSAPQAFINAVSQNSPMFLLGIFFGPAVTGLYALTNKILMMPGEF